MSASLARYLQDFSEPHVVPVPLMTDSFSDEMDDDLALLPIDTQVDVEAERTEAFEQGRRAAADELQQQFDDEKRALVAAHAEELAALREKFAEEASTVIAARFQEIATVTAQAISDQTARILSPLLDEALVAKSVSDMADIIRNALIEGELGTLTVRGPVHLFEKLKIAMGEETVLLRHIEAPDLDIAVDIGETALVTRISAWSASLKKVLG